LVAREAVGDFDRHLHEIRSRDLDSRYADDMTIAELLTPLRANGPGEPA